MSEADNKTEFEQFLKLHQPQLISSDIPEIFWPSLFYKLKNGIYDAGKTFQIQQVFDESEESSDYSWKVVAISEEDIEPSDSFHIYLIDHCWTFRTADARPALQTMESLKSRMISMMDVNTDGLNDEEQTEAVLKSMWKYCQTYKFGHLDRGSNEAMPVWYIMDEFGSYIQHSDSPSVRIVPFFHSDTQLAYSLLWPVKTLKTGDEVARNFVDHVADDCVRSARLLPWVHQDMKHVDFKNEEPSTEHFETFKMNESRPSESFEYPGLPKDKNLRVYVEYSAFSKHLTDKRFEIVEKPEDADVLWYSKHFRDFRELSERQPSTLVNQFPNDMVVTVKDMLAITGRRAATSGASDPMEANPKWLPVTYDLQTELPKFVSYFQHREERGLDNTWICKPWNLARGLDMYVTDNLDQIVRLPDAGPKVACKYIENPVLFHREDLGAKVKFDIRYIVIVNSVKPLKLFAYKVFWLRFSNKPYSLDHLDDYEKHFTVMNYDNRTLKQIHYDDFIPMFEAQNPDFTWADVENDIFIMFRELFEAAGSQPPPRGICPNPQSRAMYAIDLMLSWDKKPNGDKCIQPMICEVNFSPDCDRAVLYHPFFVNDLFSVMFLDDIEDKHVTPI